MGILYTAGGMFHRFPKHPSEGDSMIMVNSCSFYGAKYLCWCKRDAMSLKKKKMYSAVAYYAWAHLDPKYWAAAVEMAFPQLWIHLSQVNVATVSSTSQAA